MFEQYNRVKMNDENEPLIPKNVKLEKVDQPTHYYQPLCEQQHCSTIIICVLFLCISIAMISLGFGLLHTPKIRQNTDIDLICHVFAWPSRGLRMDQCDAVNELKTFDQLNKSHCVSGSFLSSQKRVNALPRILHGNFGFFFDKNKINIYFGAESDVCTPCRHERNGANDPEKCAKVMIKHVQYESMKFTQRNSFYHKEYYNLTAEPSNNFHGVNSNQEILEGILKSSQNEMECEIMAKAGYFWNEIGFHYKLRDIQGVFRRCVVGEDDCDILALIKLKTELEKNQSNSNL